MLEKEYNLLEERLDRKDHKNVRFFAFADTAATINFDKTNKGHGWMGVRFQITPDGAPNDFIIHILLNDQDSKLQQETIGIIGMFIISKCCGGDGF